MLIIGDQCLVGCWITRVPLSKRTCILKKPTVKDDQINPKFALDSLTNQLTFGYGKTVS